MTKKVKFIIVIFSLITIGVIGYLFYTNLLQRRSTGAIYNPPSTQELAEGKAIAALQDALPLIKRYQLQCLQS